MNRKEYDQLRNMTETPGVISVDDLQDPDTDRSLLYGYTVNRNTVHVYLEHGFIHVVVYNFRRNVIRSLEMNMDVYAKDCVPDKRVYPDATDFDFCLLLISRGMHIPFTKFRDDTKPQQFYGYRLSELK